MDSTKLTPDDVANTQKCLTGLQACLKLLPTTPRPHESARLLVDAAGRHARTFHTLALLPDPWGHAPGIRQAATEMEVICGEARRHL